MSTHPLLPDFIHHVAHKGMVIDSGPNCYCYCTQRSICGRRWDHCNVQFLLRLGTYCFLFFSFGTLALTAVRVNHFPDEQQPQPEPLLGWFLPRERMLELQCAFFCSL